MTPDRALLRQYVERGDEAAFAEVVRRHVNMVYGASYRLVGGDGPLAEEVTQLVFTEMGRQAARLASHPTLAGWLHTCAHFIASKQRRDLLRRKIHEEEAIAMHPATTAPDRHWESLCEELDEAVNRLAPDDRNALLLRYFEGRSHREVGEALGLNENTARMRVERALEKLRAQFSRRGVTTTAALLAATLGAHGQVSAPAGFAANIAGKSLAGIGTGASVGVPVSAGKSVIVFAVGGVAAVALVILLLLQSRPVTPVTTPPTTARVQLPVAQATQPSPATSAPMKTTTLINAGTMAAALLAAAPAATAQSDMPPLPPPPPPPLFVNATPPSEAPASTPPAVAPIVPSGDYAALVKANNQFALDVFRAFAPKATDNAFFSPYSISTALAMTWQGANGDTAAQMAKVLHFADLAAKDVAPDFAALQRDVVKAQTLSGAQLSLANSLWAEQNPEQPLRQDYLDQVLTNFGAPVTMLDFKAHADDAAKQINAWVEDKTNHKIQNLVHYPGDIDGSTRLVLVNAIYFKGQWLSPFRPMQNINSEFLTADGGSIPAVLMHQNLNTSYADITDGPVPCQILALHYSSQDHQGGSTPPSGVSLVVVLPRATGDLGALTQSLTADKLDAMLGRLSTQLVTVYFPKFKLDERYLLANTLMAMGIQDAFNPDRADFSGMDGARDLYISKVIHQTFLNVDEAGTEAAAATAVVMAFGGGGPRPPPPLFRADHPFLFLIRDDVTGSILFLGQLTNPDPMHDDAVAARGARGRGTGVRGTARRGATAPAPAANTAPTAVPPGN